MELSGFPNGDRIDLASRKMADIFQGDCNSWDLSKEFDVICQGLCNVVRCGNFFLNLYYLLRIFHNGYLQIISEPVLSVAIQIQIKNEKICQCVIRTRTQRVQYHCRYNIFE